ncbi:FliC/FljB family flagellin [Halomonas sp. KX33721]|uniref:FliC/FljB family flagellin n=1 Tax=Halomonas sp. KX33721 TaxID=1819251 RepID=UPI0007849A2C|nr:FliC/FljB family flagellin [Halomonas sp. KX33721]
MSVINTNITSMIGQSNLQKSQSALQTSMERLSSGLRINSAKDDAAGQAIANRMTAQITGLAQAQRNANDGISVAQTAEGALNQVNDNLQRIRELSVQAQNDTNSANDLQSIQDEIGQRLDEIDRISKETEFNGVKVLAEDTGLKIQVGANDGQQITVNLQEINAATLKLDDFRVAADQQATLDQLVDDFGAQQQTRASYNGTGATVNAAIEIDADGKAVLADDSAVYLMDDGDFTSTEARAAVAVANIANTTDGAAAAGWTAQGTYNGSETAAEYKATLEDGRVVTATVNNTDDSFSYQIDGKNFGGDLFLADGGGFTVVENRNQATEADLEDSSLERTDATYAIDTTIYRVNIDGEVRNDNDVAVYVSADNEGNPTLALEGDQRAATDNPLAALDSALKQVDSLRSELGAVQNRFESAITNLQTNETNLSAARSRIEDADYAVEVANMTRAQILQQAGTSVLAQANQIPQNVLSLLG